MEVIGASRFSIMRLRFSETVNEAHGLEKMSIAIDRKCSQRMRKRSFVSVDGFVDSCLHSGNNDRMAYLIQRFRYYTETDNTSVQRKRNNYLMLPCKTYSCAFQQEEIYNQYNM